MEWLASELWNLFYVAATAFAFARAYYSRHEQIQKVMAYLVLTYPIGVIASGTDWHAIAFLVIDAAGFAWCTRLIQLDPSEPATRWCSILFLAMLMAGPAISGLEGLVAYNVLYLAQLSILSIYGKRYGLQARQVEGSRNDFYFRLVHGRGNPFLAAHRDPDRHARG